MPTSVPAVPSHREPAPTSPGSRRTTGGRGVALRLGGGAVGIWLSSPSSGFSSPEL